MKKKVYDCIIENFCFDNFFLKDVCIEQPNGVFKKISKMYDVIVFNSKKIIFFSALENDISENDAVVSLRTFLNFIASKLGLSLNDFLVGGVNDTNVYLLNTYNNRLNVFNINDDISLEIVEHFDNELSFGNEIFDCSSIRGMVDKLNFSSNVKATDKSKKRIMVDNDGVIYINKHGRWREASEFDTHQIFLLSVFGGMFGAHLFYMKKPSKGILYFITFGLFGIGWLFDSLEILFGIYKDPDGKYLLPYENKPSGFIVLVIGAVVLCLLGALIMFLFNFVAENSSGIIDSILSGFIA